MKVEDFISTGIINCRTMITVIDLNCNMFVLGRGYWCDKHTIAYMPLDVEKVEYLPDRNCVFFYVDRR